MRRSSLPVWAGIALLAGGLLAPNPAAAYEPASTHAGMTERAAIHGNFLHTWLTRVHGLGLGAYEPISLRESRLPARLRFEMARHLRMLDPTHGYAPRKRGWNRAIGWLVAGSVLEAMPFSRGRNHFLDPRSGRGLKNRSGRWSSAFKMRVLDFIDGDGHFGGIWNGANFNLDGKSVLEWARSKWNYYRLAAHHRHRLAALTSKDRQVRRHHLSMALMSAGALLHLLQNMGTPAHTRNDFVGSYLARRSNINLDRLSAYESYVRKRYGRTGIPAVKGTLPRFDRFDHFFTNKRRIGLADETQRRFFSRGSLPKDTLLHRGITVQAVMKRVQRSLPFAEPRVRSLDLLGAAKGGRYFKNRAGQILFAYRIDSRGMLQFALDDRCYRAASDTLVAETVRYSAALLRFLFRGQLGLKLRPTPDAKGLVLEVRHLGPRLAGGSLILLAEDKHGTRTKLRTETTPKGIASGTALSQITVEAPRSTVRLVAAWSGKDAVGEPLVMGGRVSLPR